ncbi:resolvase [bacterium]|nr:resolvase [bacterium]
MMNFEFNMDDAKEVWQEEAMEDGFRRGREEGMARMFETLADLVKDGIITLADAANRANVTVSEFEAKTGLAS